MTGTGRDLSLRNRESKSKGRTELVKEEQLIAENCSRTHKSCAWEITSSTADSSVSDKKPKSSILFEEEEEEEERSCSDAISEGGIN